MDLCNILVQTVNCELQNFAVVCNAFACVCSSSGSNSFALEANSHANLILCVCVNFASAFANLRPVADSGASPPILPVTLSSLSPCRVTKI
jgi:hypothetical protein